MANEAELKAVFDIFKHDQGLVLEATRALAWAAERKGLVLSSDEKRRFSFALAAAATTFAVGPLEVSELQCASKGCGGGGDNGSGGIPTG